MRWALVLIFFVASSAVAARSSDPEWLGLARRYTGESEAARKEAERKLRKLKTLENDLRTEIAKTDSASRFLAYDVIAGLALSGLVADLQNAAKRDPSGYPVHALNALLNDENRATFTSFYRELLVSTESYHPSPATSIALLDTLARLGALLEPKQVRALLESPSFEVRSAALYYVRHLTIRLEQWEYLPLARYAFQGPKQLRLQAVHLLSEVPASSRAGRGALRDLPPLCQKDQDPEVRSHCERLPKEDRQ